MSCTDGRWVCRRCMDFRTICQLCEDLPTDVIPTPQSILDAEKELTESMSPVRMFPFYH